MCPNKEDEEHESKVEVLARSSGMYTNFDIILRLRLHPHPHPYVYINENVDGKHLRNFIFFLLL